LLAHRGGCSAAARENARGLTLRVVAMLMKLRQRAAG
jgi:hypothetical protein